MRKASRRKIERRRLTTPSGQEVEIVRPPSELLELSPSIPDAMAEAIVRDIRSDGGLLWLVAMPGDEVRCRILHPGGASDEMATFLQRHMRAIAKAVDRLGADEPPADNPWGDRAPAPGGHWDWLEANP